MARGDRMGDGAVTRSSRPLRWRAIAAIALGVAATACQKVPDEIAPPAQPVIDGRRISFPKDGKQTSLIRSATADAYFATSVLVPGRLAWNEERTSRIFSPVAGRVVALLAAPGKAVRKGEALATISSPDIGQAQAEVHKAETDLALAQKGLARAEALHGAGVIALKDLQSAQADVARAQAERDRTRARENLYGQATSGGIDQLYRLTSPIAGIVVERNINPGQEVRPDQAQPGNPALFVVTDPTALWAQLELPESLLDAVAPGKQVSLVASAFPGQRFAAKVEFVADAIDPASRTVKARATVANPDRRLKGEMFVNAEVPLALEPMPKVPSSAVILVGDKQYAFVDVGDYTYERRQVSADEVRLGLMRIRSGVTAGEKVVVEGALLLQQTMAGRKEK